MAFLGHIFGCCRKSAERWLEVVGGLGLAIEKCGANTAGIKPVYEMLKGFGCPAHRKGGPDVATGRYQSYKTAEIFGSSMFEES